MLAAQTQALPAPMKIIPVEKLDFEPSADNSCVSVEGPEIVKYENSSSKTLPDDFTRCALSLFEPQLDITFNDGTSSKDGTQSTAEAIEALEQCFKGSTKHKHAILIGHGSPGSIATGNGTNPHDGQNIDVGTKTAIGNLRSLNASDLLLFGCETGIGEFAMQLLNSISDQRFPTRARNSLVMCSLDEAQKGARKGLYVFSGSDQQWITAQPKALLAQSNRGAVVNIDQGSCFALKGTDRQFNVIQPDEFKRKKEHGNISLFNFRSENAIRQGVFSEFEILPRGDLTQFDFSQALAQDPDLLDDVDFCRVLREDLVPDRKIVGAFALNVDGKSRQFYALSGGLAQDVEHPEVYYPMKSNAITGLSFRISQKWNEMLFRLQQEKLQNELKRPDKKLNR